MLIYMYHVCSFLALFYSFFGRPRPEKISYQKTCRRTFKVEWMKLLTAAEKEGIVVVAAAGNLVGIDRKTPLYYMS